jgi:hypothetical protein
MKGSSEAECSCPKAGGSNMNGYAVSKQDRNRRINILFYVSVLSFNQMLITADFLELTFFTE